MRLREELSARGIRVGTVVTEDPTHFRVDGVPQEQDAVFRQAAADAQTNFDRRSGSGGAYVFAMKPHVQPTLREEAVVRNRAE